jgi:hypothetical protein
VQLPWPPCLNPRCLLTSRLEVGIYLVCGT